MLAGVADCAPIPGSAAILNDRTIDYIVVGEFHGTNEAPGFFGDMVCLAAARGPVMVALEIPVEDQGAVDAYLASNGDAAAREALLKANFWASRDGRSSTAMLALIERLRSMSRGRQILGVAATQPRTGSAQGDETSYNRAMAAEWMGAMAGHPGARVLALVGNAHAVPGKVQLGQGFDFLPAASFLPRKRTATLGNAEVGGAAWMCGRQANCGRQSLGEGLRSWPRSVWRSTEKGDPLYWDYLYAPGTPFTVAVPARPAQ
ncbi:hypothetical protein P6144_06325 [Sphingomonas sp. HITSZ_GF]|uniref:hypothetical protein n=1 Tax=Sphingomonas sp. HITSZ_GF TaxID=3037247 RepID=UPI00240DAE47|nr:hypothetical protein [Sphingomonas sp. HITSZ_GF]MDG2533255.1 hypothetical protein [Sphingomonas sp. HITSZ_GF]